MLVITRFGAVIGQQNVNYFHVIYYASKVLNETQVNYMITEKEVLAIIFALKNTLLPN